MREFFKLLLCLALVSPALAHAQSLTIQGKIFDGANRPVTGAATKFRVKVLSPDTQRCVLFDETHTVNLSSSQGLFSVNLGNGFGTQNAPATYSLTDALSNRTLFTVSAAYCAGGGSGSLTYNPGVNDNRKVVIEFLDPATMGSAWEAIPEMDLNPVAWAMESRTVGGFPAASLLRVVGGGVPGSAPTLTSAEVSELQALAAGTSAHYMQRGMAGGAQLPTYPGSPSSPSAGSIWFDSSAGGAIRYYDGSTIRTIGTGAGTLTSVVGGDGISASVTSGTATVSLSPSGVGTGGTRGSATLVPQITYDTYGRITGITEQAIGSTLPGAGADHQVLMSNSGSWGASYIGLSDLRKDAGTPLFPGTCATNRTLNWNSVNGVFECVDLGAIASPQLAAPSGTAAATYRSVSVNAAGQVLSGTNPTTLGGYFIGDAVQNGGSVPRIRSGAADPSGAGVDGELYVATTSQKIFRYNLGTTTWETMASAGGAGGTMTGINAGPGVSVSGSAATPTVGLSTAGVASGTFAKVTTDTYGRVTSGSAQVGDAEIADVAFSKLTGKPTTLAGHGITEALVSNAGGALSLQAGGTGGRPTPGTAGQIYIDTDTNTVYYRGASAWTAVGSGSTPSFTGSLAGEVTGTQGATQVSQIGSFLRATILGYFGDLQNATDTKTNGTLVKRDGTGGFAAGAITADSVVLKGASSGTATLRAPATVTTYDVQLPPTAPTAGQVLSATSGSALTWTTPLSGSSISVSSPLTNPSGTIGINTASGSQAGALSSSDWTTFNNKLGTALTAASIWVGNASNVATAVAPSGDVAVSNAGAFTVSGIKGQNISAAGTAAGQMLRYAGTNTWTPGFVSMADLRSTVTGTTAITGNCTASQTLTWNSGSDNLQCQSISIAAATQITGVLPIANGGTGANSTSQGFVFAGPATGGPGAPAFRALAATDLPNEAKLWQETSGNVHRVSGNVGIGTSAPAAKLEVSGAAIVNGGLELGHFNSTGQFRNILDNSAGRFLDFGFTGISSQTGEVRFHRETNTTGAASVAFYRGDGTATADHTIVGGSSGIVATFARNGGFVGIGTSAPTAQLETNVTGSDLSASGAHYAAKFNSINTLSANAAGRQVGLRLSTTLDQNGFNNSGGSGASGSLVPLEINPIVKGTSGTVTSVFGISSGGGNTAAGGTVDHWASFLAAPPTTTGTVTNLYGFVAGNPANGAPLNYATPVNTYGFYSKVDSGSSNYGFYSAGTAQNYFRGSVGIGTTAPTALLHLKAGTATPGTAPLKFSTGTSLTTPENGAVEFDGTDLYLTSGGARRKLAATSGTNDFTGVNSITGGSGTLAISAGGTNQNLTLAGSGTGQVQSSSILNVTNSTSATSSSTGALRVAGGLGVAGDIFAGATINALTSMMAPQIYGSTAANGTLKLDGTSNATKGPLLLNSAGGNVGIATTSPSSRLSLYGGTGGTRADGLQICNGGSCDYRSYIYNDLSNTLNIDSNGDVDLRNGASNVGFGKIAFKTASGTANVPAGTGASITRMLIDHDGKVGIGTTAPTAFLHVHTGTNEAFRVDHNGSGVWIGATTDDGGNGLPLTFGGSVYNFTTGNVGIGTTTPLTQIHLGGTYSSFQMGSSATASDNFHWVNENGGGRSLNLYNGNWGFGTKLLAIRPGGNVGIGTDSPAAKLDVAGTIRATGLDIPGAQQITETRSIPTTVNDAVDIGTFALMHSGQQLSISISVANGSFSVSKNYFVSRAYCGGGMCANGTWYEALPLGSSGPLSGNDFALDVQQVDTASQTFNMRVRRTSGSTAGTAVVSIRNLGSASATYAASTAVNSVTAPTLYAPSTVITQIGGKLGIGTASPFSVLHVKNAGIPGGAPTSSGTADPNVLTRIEANVATMDVGMLANGNTWLQPRDKTNHALNFATLLNPNGGNVGIGTTAPSSKLHISGGLNSWQDGIFLQQTGTGGRNYALASREGGIFSISDESASLHRFTIASNGFVGIGTTAPTFALDLVTNSTNAGRLSSSSSETMFQLVNTSTNGRDWRIASGGSAGGFAGGKFGIYDNTAGLARLTIDPSGGVGIGTSAPGQRLSVTDSLSITNTSGSQYLLMGNQDSVGANHPAIIKSQNGAIEFGSGTSWSGGGGTFSLKMVLGDNGYVGIGTSAPSTNLDVVGGAGPLRLRNSSYANHWVTGPDSGNSFVVYNHAGTGAYINNGSTTWSSTSDRRLKREILPIEDALAKLKQISGVTYHYKTDAAGAARSAGVIAQDVQKVLPEAVTQKDGFLGVKYTEVIPLVINAVKELAKQWADDREVVHRELASLKQENVKLQEKNAALEARLLKIEAELQAPKAPPKKK